MPNYEYLCEISGKEFEAEHSIKIVLEDCPLCKENDLPAHAPKRLISRGGKGIVEKSFNELRESMPGDVAKIKQRAGRDEKFLANLVGESKYNRNQS